MNNDKVWKMTVKKYMENIRWINRDANEWEILLFCVVYGRPLRIDILIEINNERIVAVPEA